MTREKAKVKGYLIGGELSVDQAAIDKEIRKVFGESSQGVMITIESIDLYDRELKINNTFYGPVLKQCVKALELMEGVTYSPGVIKKRLIRLFIGPKKQYHDKEKKEPIYVRRVDPKNNRVYYEPRYKLPGWSDLSYEEKKSVISRTRDLFYHRFNVDIVIDSKKRRR